MSSSTNQLLKKIKKSGLIRVMKRTFREFGEENSMFHGAALAYYAVFAMVPLLYLAISTFGFFVGNQNMMEIISTILKENVGLQDTDGLLTFMANIDFEKSNWLLRIAGILALLISSTAFLTSMRQSISVFFDVTPEFSNKRKKIVTSLLSRLNSLMVMGLMGLVVVVFYFAEITFLSLMDEFISHYETLNGGFRFLLNHAIPIFTNTIIFWFVFKFLHDGQISWNLAWKGGLFTGVMLYLGQIFIKYYLTHYFFASGAGVAGSIIVILVWMFYTSQIIFLGAKFTKVLGDEVKDPILRKSY